MPNLYQRGRTFWLFLSCVSIPPCIFSWFPLIITTIQWFISQSLLRCVYHFIYTHSATNHWNCSVWIGVEMEVRNDVAATPMSSPAVLKQVKASPTAVDTNSVTQRLQKELMALMMCGSDLGVSAFPEGDNIFTWIGTIEGCKDTVYEGLSYKLSLHFPLDYPFNPPQVKFETLCFHPNVDQYGNICLDILQDKWSSAYDCRTVLLSIQSLLGEPNNESPLNSSAAALWKNKEEYRKMVHRCNMSVEVPES